MSNRKRGVERRQPEQRPTHCGEGGHHHPGRGGLAGHPALPRRAGLARATPTVALVKYGTVAPGRAGTPRLGRPGRPTEEAGGTSRARSNPAEPSTRPQWPGSRHLLLVEKGGLRYPHPRHRPGTHLVSRRHTAAVVRPMGHHPTTRPRVNPHRRGARPVGAITLHGLGRRLNPQAGRRHTPQPPRGRWTTPLEAAPHQAKLVAPPLPPAPRRAAPFSREEGTVTSKAVGAPPRRQYRGQHQCM